MAGLKKDLKLVKGGGRRLMGEYRERRYATQTPPARSGHKHGIVQRSGFIILVMIGSIITFCLVWHLSA